MMNDVLMIFMCCGYVVYLMLIDVQSLNAIVECHCVITWTRGMRGHRTYSSRIASGF